MMLLPYIAICLLSFNILKGQLEDENIYEIVWAKNLGLENNDKDVQSVMIKTLNNEDYNCVLNKESFSKDKIINDVESPLTYMESLFAQTICSYKIENYWIYELCHGKHFRQYHEEKSTDPKGPVSKQEYVLGKFPKQLTYLYANGTIHSLHMRQDPFLIFNELLLTAEEILDKITQGISPINRNIENQSDKNETEKINTRIVRTAMNLESSVKTYLKIDLDEGTYCALKKGNRSTTLFYFCDAQGLNQIHYLAETSTCEYQLFVATPLLCNHPDFSPKSNLAPIQCYSTNFDPRKENTLNVNSPQAPLSPTQGIKPKALVKSEREEFKHFINSQISRFNHDRLRDDHGLRLKCVLARILIDVVYYNRIRPAIAKSNFYSLMDSMPTLKDEETDNKVPTLNVDAKQAFPAAVTSKFKEFEKLKSKDSSQSAANAGSGKNTRKTVTSSRIGGSNIVKIEIKIENDPPDHVMPADHSPISKRGDVETHEGVVKTSPNLKGEIEAKGPAVPRKISEKEEAFLKDIATSTGKISHKILLVDDNVAQNFIDGLFCIKGGGLGWWKYEFCLWKHLIQYHDEPDKPEELENLPIEEDEEFTFSAGKGVEKGEKSRIAITLGRWEPAAHLKWLIQNDLESLKNPKLRNRIKYYYADGDYCEEIQANRQAVIKLRCVRMENNPNYISMYLSEKSTCNYVLSVDSPIICALLDKVGPDGLRKTATRSNTQA